MAKINSQNKKTLIAIAFAGITFLFLAVLIATNPFQVIQLKLSDNLYGVPDKTAKDIILVGIDKATLNSKELGMTDVSSWSRNVYAKALNNLNKYNPSVTAFDIIFFAEKDAKGDDAFISTLNESSNPVLISNLGIEYHSTSGVFFRTDKVLDVYPNPKFAELKNVSVGYNNFLQDEDDVVRKYPYLISDSFNATPYESFAYEVVKNHLGQPVDIPPDPQVINYSTDFYTNSYVPFIDLYNDNYNFFNPSEFEDKIVVIGPHDITFNDESFTPISSKYKLNNMVIHANAIQTLLDGKFLKYESTAEKLIVVLFLCLLSVFVFMFTKIRWSFLYLVGVPAGYTLAAPLMFNAGVIVDLIHPYLAVVSTFMAVYIYRYLTEFKEKTAIRSAFSKYVSPEIVNKIAENPELLKLGGEERQITVLFTDIVHFTNISEQLSPESLVALLNEYFEVMIQVIKDEGGTLDKLEGDSIMAFFGAPLDVPDSEFRACGAALKMRIKLDELMEKWKNDSPLPGGEKKPTLDFRCGINSGTAIVGNIGALDRFEYTAIGDTVNLASRLEGANKKYGTNMMISEFTYEKIKDKFVARELDLIRVVGKAKPVRVYELMGGIEDVSNDAKKLVATFNEGILMYQSRKFAEAMEKFEMILKVYPNDNPSKLYRQRCEVLKDFPPDKEWDGVFEMGSK